MLVSAAFMQSMAAFTAQTRGWPHGPCHQGPSVCHGPFLRLRPYHGLFHLFHGDILAGLFTSSPSVMAAAADYLKAYAFDAFLTSFLFCFIGFYNGLGLTSFVMLKGYWDPLGSAFPFPIS